MGRHLKHHEPNASPRRARTSRNRLATLGLSAVVLCAYLDAAAQNSSSVPSPSTPSSTGVKHVVRHPGGATGARGGVGFQSRPLAPADAAAVRSPGKSSAARPGVAAGTALDLQQAAVLERVNYHRGLAGLAVVEADARLLAAAQSHSGYLDSADEMGHYEDKKTNPYYTGNSPFDRIDAAHYDYAEAGEVVARQASSHPAAAVDALMSAIYHRFIILSVDFVNAGPGAVLQVHQGSDELDVTVDFGAQTLPPLPPAAALTVYPTDTQTQVPSDFDPAEEFPNPMPGHTLVGYPISVQVDARYAFVPGTFELYELAPYTPRRVLEVKVLTHAVDAETPAYAAALIPLSPLAPGTLHQVVFSGSVNAVAVSKTWQFMTAPDRKVTMRFASPTVVPGAVQQITLEGLDTERGPYYLCYAPAQLVKSLVHETETQIAMTTSDECAPGALCQVSVSASYRACAKPFASGTFTIAR